MYVCFKIYFRKISEEYSQLKKKQDSDMMMSLKTDKEVTLKKLNNITIITLLTLYLFQQKQAKRVHDPVNIAAVSAFKLIANR